MFSTTRRIVAIGVLAGGSIAVLAGWLTGFFAWVMADVSRTWDRLLAWLQEPVDMGHLVAAMAVLVPLVLILVVIMVLSDD